MDSDPLKYVFLSFNDLYQTPSFTLLCYWCPACEFRASSALHGQFLTITGYFCVPDFKKSIAEHINL